jgi:hypothetical protein
MRRIPLILLLVAATTEARADDDLPLITAPSGWTADDVHREIVERDLLALLPSGATAGARAAAYQAPRGGATLIAWGLEVAVAREGEGLVRARLEDLRTTPADEARIEGGVTRTVDWAETSDAADRMITARLVWSDDTDGILTVARRVWLRPIREVVTFDTIVEYGAECVIAADRAAELQPACERALASLSYEPLDHRAPIAMAAIPEPAAAGPAAPQMRPTPEGTVIVPGPGPGPSASRRDWRPFWVGGGLLIVIAAVLLARSRRKETLTRLEDAEAAGAPAAEPAPDPEEPS